MPGSGNIYGNEWGQPNTAGGGGSGGPPPSAPNPQAGTPDIDGYQKFLAALGMDANSTGMVDVIKAAYQMAKNGVPNPDILDFIRTSDAYKARYPGIADAWKRGYPMTEADYQGVEHTIQQKFREYGLSTDAFATREQVGRIIGAGVSPLELDTRLQSHQQAALAGVDPAARAYMRSLGITDGDLTGFWLNPDLAMPEMLNKANTAIAGGAAAASGFDVGADEAAHLASLATKQGQAADWNQYSQAAAQAGIARQLTGTIGQNQSVDQNTLLDATIGQDTAATAAVSRAARAREAEFAGSGGYVMGQGGVTGLGSANR